MTDNSEGEILHCGCYFDAGHDCGLYSSIGASIPQEPEDENDYFDRMSAVYHDGFDFYRYDAGLPQ